MESSSWKREMQRKMDENAKRNGKVRTGREEKRRNMKRQEMRGRRKINGRSEGRRSNEREVKVDAFETEQGSEARTITACRGRQTTQTQRNKGKYNQETDSDRHGRYINNIYIKMDTHYNNNYTT